MSARTQGFGTPVRRGPLGHTDQSQSFTLDRVATSLQFTSSQLDEACDNLEHLGIHIYVPRNENIGSY